jgi:P4 family phage/plasmid primase-like protien
MIQSSPWHERTISTYNGVDPVPSGNLRVIDVLTRIKIGDGGLKEAVAVIRELWTKVGKSAADKKKKSLPGATFGGQFTYRDTDYLTEMTGLCVLDLDDVPGVVEVRKRMIFEDKHVLAAWMSPRGNGIKVLVEFDVVDPDSHDRCWASARAYFDHSENLRLDSSAADLYRLTYLSHDNDILIRPDGFVAEPFFPMSEEFYADQPKTNRPNQKTSKKDKTDDKTKIKTKTKKLKDLDGEYDAIRDLGWSQITCPTLSMIDPSLVGRAMSLVQMKNSSGEVMLIEIPPESGVFKIGPGNRDHIVNAWAFAVGKIGLTEEQAADAVRAFVADCVHQVAGNEYELEEIERQSRRAAKVVRTEDRNTQRAEGKIPPAIGDRKDDRVKVYEDKESAKNDDDEMTAPQRAREVINAHLSTPEGLPTLIRWNEDDYEYDSLSGWRCLHHEILPHYMAVRLGSLPGVSQSHIDSTTKHIRQLLTRDLTSRIPCRLSTGQYLPRLCLFKNTGLDFGGINSETGKPTTVIKDPDVFSLYTIPHNYEPTATCPKWLTYLSEQFSGDLDRVATMQEWFGYHLIPDNDLQKLCILVGPTRSGKGTTMHVLREMLGEYRCTSAMADDLTSDFAMQPWVGKLSVLLDDVNEGGSRYGLMPTVDKLKSIVGSRTVTVNRKNKMKIEASVSWKFTITTNDIPRMRDDSGAMAKRMVVIPYDKSHAGRENPRLADELCAELPGILAWAVEGLARLSKTHRFTESEKSRNRADQIRLESTPLLRFSREMFIFSEDGSGTIQNDVVYAVYERWCKENGEHMKPRNSLFKAMRAQEEFAAVQFTQIRVHEGENIIRPKVMRGLRWSSDGLTILSSMGIYPSAAELEGTND